MCLGIGAALSLGAGTASADTNPAAPSAPSRNHMPMPPSAGVGRDHASSRAARTARPLAAPATAPVARAAARIRVNVVSGGIRSAVPRAIPQAIPTPNTPRPASRRDPALVNATAGAVPVAPAAAAATAPTTVTGSAGLVLNLIWNSSVSAAPASFKAAVVQAAEMIGSRVADKITLNITVGYGEVGGWTLSAGSAAAGTLGDQWQSYATVKQELINSATSATDQSVIANLPTNTPFASRPIDVPSAQLKLFGVTPANGSTLDGEMGFSGDWGSNLVAAALHEITHAMGRNAGWGSNANGNWITPLDLIRYAAPGVLNADGSVATSARLQYFSIDGGQTVLANYSTSSDYGDWATNYLTASDPYNAYVSNNSNALTAVDLLVLDAIGYTIVAAGATGRPIAPTRSALTSGQSTNQITGLVTGLLGFTNPDTEALAYAVTTNPASGTVVVTSAGAYTYTPNASVRIGTPGTPLTDSFSVTATNNAGSAAVSVPVSITGTPIAATAATITSGQTSNGSTGVVTGLLGFTNPDTGAVTYTVTSGPTQGTVVVSANGAYTYTPNASARTGTTATDGFSVTAANATGGTTVSVTVPVIAAVSAPVSTPVSAPQSKTRQRSRPHR